MTVVFKKYILASSEFALTPLGEFFLGLGFHLTQDENEKNIYFAVNNSEEKNLKFPTINISGLKSWKETDRAYVECPSYNPDLVKLFENYFSQKEDFDLIDRYSKDFKQIYSLKLMDSLSSGYVIDTVIVEAYKNEFPIDKIRKYLNESLSYMYSLLEKKGVTLPIDLSFSHDADVFALAMTIAVDKFNEKKSLFNDMVFIESLVSSTNFCDISFLISRGRLTITSLWLKKNPELKSFFVNQIEKRTKAQRYDRALELADIDTDVKYRPNYTSQKQDLTLLGLARRIAMFIKSNHKDDFNFLNSLDVEMVKKEASTYPIAVELEGATEEVYLKILQLLKIENFEESITVEGAYLEDNSTTIIKGEQAIDDGVLKVKSLGGESNRILELEKKATEYEYKFNKVLDQHLKLKKMVDQMKTEYLKLKNAKTDLYVQEQSKEQAPESPKDNDLKLIELNQDVDKLKVVEKNLQKEKEELENLVLVKDLKISQLEQKIENFKKEFLKSKEHSAQERVLTLESENKVLNAKIEIISKNLQNVTSASTQRDSDILNKKDKELESAKTQLQMLQALIAKLKKEKNDEEERMRLEIIELRNTVSKNKNNNAENILNNTLMSISKNTNEEKVSDEKFISLFSEKKILEEKFKEQGFEIKKLEHKLKIMTSQLDEATKKKRKQDKGSGSSNEAYIKQVEVANKKVMDVTLELTEKKKEILKLKQDNGQMASKVSELERKISNFEKKSA